MDERTRHDSADHHHHDHDDPIAGEVENPVDLKLHDMLETESKKKSLNLSMKMKSYLTSPLDKEQIEEARIRIDQMHPLRKITNLEELFPLFAPVIVSFKRCRGKNKN